MDFAVKFILSIWVIATLLALIVGVISNFWFQYFWLKKKCYKKGIKWYHVFSCDCMDGYASISGSVAMEFFYIFMVAWSIFGLGFIIAKYIL